MNKIMRERLHTWPKAFIRDTDFAILLKESAEARYGLIKRALKSGELIRLKRGVYLIGKPYKKMSPNLYEVAQLIYGPSYISVESALSYHQWIPEAVYVTTSVTPKRATLFKTPVGEFSFSTIPVSEFYLGVERIETQDAIFLMATPLKALADYVYIYSKTWKTIQEMAIDLRIEFEKISSINPIDLKVLSNAYPSKRVKLFLNQILKEVF